jgi:hypothetical protein
MHPRHLGLVTSVNASHINGLRPTILGKCIRSWHRSIGSLEQSAQPLSRAESKLIIPVSGRVNPSTIAYSDAVVQINYCSLCAVNA